MPTSSIRIFPAKSWACAVGSRSHFGARQRQRDLGAGAVNAAHGDVAAVQLRDALDDREAEPLATLAGGRRDTLAALVEAVEELRHVGRRDAGAGVGDADLHPLADDPCGERDAVAAAAELERVVDEVRDG